MRVINFWRTFWSVLIVMIFMSSYDVAEFNGTINFTGIFVSVLGSFAKDFRENLDFHNEILKIFDLASPSKVTLYLNAFLDWFSLCSWPLNSCKFNKKQNQLQLKSKILFISSIIWILSSLLVSTQNFLIWTHHTITTIHIKEFSWWTINWRTFRS